MYSLVDVILLVALLVTSVSAFMMHRKLSRLQHYHDRYEALLKQTGDALDSASAAVASFTRDGQTVMSDLGTRIETARSVLSDLDAKSNAIEAQRAKLLGAYKDLRALVELKTGSGFDAALTADETRGAARPAADEIGEIAGKKPPRRQ